MTTKRNGAAEDYGNRSNQPEKRKRDTVMGRNCTVPETLGLE